MKVCVYGAGAVGGAMALRLRSAGEDVTVVARGAHGDAIRDRGLTLISGDARRTVRIRCVDDPAELGAQDVVIVTVKGHQLPAIATRLMPLLAPNGRVLFAMNGIPWWFAEGLPISMPPSLVESLDPGGALRKNLDIERVIGAVVQSSSEVVEPGVVWNTTPGRNRLVIGRVSGDNDDAVAGVAALLTRGGYETSVTPGIREEIWNKMVLWVAVAPVAALTGMALNRLVPDPGAYALLASIMREGIEIGRRMGFDPIGDVDQRLGFYHDKPTVPSLLKDFEVGREPELANSVLAFQAIATHLGVNAPHIDTCATLLRMKAAAASA
jgi:2-dehydropantoate 2-reductase